MRIHTTILALLFAAPAAFAQDQDRDQVRDQDQTQQPDRDQDQDQTRAQDRDQDPTGDQDQDQTRDQDRDREQLRDRSGEYPGLRERLRSQVGLGGKDLRLSEREMVRYLTRGGDPERLQATVQAGYDGDCRAECMQEMVRTLNWARAWGMDEEAAGSLIRESLRQAEQERASSAWSDAAYGDRIRDRAQDRLREWQWERIQSIEQDRDRAREQLREMERQELQREGGGAGPGPGPGGGNN